MKKGTDIVIVASARTPFDVFGGAMRDISGVDLSAMVIKELLHRSRLAPNQIDEVNLGQCILSEAALQTDITARQALLKAGLPDTTLSNNFDRACCSSTTALQQCFKNITLGEAEVSIAIGVDNMSRAPYLLPPKYRWDGGRIGEVTLKDPVFSLGYDNYGVLAIDAGEVALEYDITREMQDAFALKSQLNYQIAKEKGIFKEEIFPVEVPQKRGKPPIVVSEDMQPRPQTTIESLTALKTVYKSPTVTAGNAPGLNAGASGLVVTTREKAEQLDLPSIATIRSVVSIARNPREIAVAPAPAIQKALSTAGVELKDIKRIEINEAFAAVPLVSTKVLAQQQTKGTGWEEEAERLRRITNVNGGAIAIGHPVGATGLRIVMTLANELKRSGGGLGVMAICGGLAQGDSIVIEV
ncbi:thiolase family protein [Lachnospiraceae bacterium ZAX-1]